MTSIRRRSVRRRGIEERIEDLERDVARLKKTVRKLKKRIRSTRSDDAKKGSGAPYDIAHWLT